MTARQVCRRCQRPREKHACSLITTDSKIEGAPLINHGKSHGALCVRSNFCQLLLVVVTLLFGGDEPRLALVHSQYVTVCGVAACPGCWMKRRNCRSTFDFHWAGLNSVESTSKLVIMMTLKGEVDLQRVVSHFHPVFLSPPTSRHLQFGFAMLERGSLDLLPCSQQAASRMPAAAE